MRSVNSSRRSVRDWRTDSLGQAFGIRLDRPGDTHRTLVVKANRVSGDPGHHLGCLGECQCFRPGEVARLANVAVSEQDGNGALRNLIAERGGHTDGAGETGAGSLGPDRGVDEAHVQGYAQKRARDADAADQLKRGRESGG